MELRKYIPKITFTRSTTQNPTSNPLVAGVMSYNTFSSYSSSTSMKLSTVYRCVNLLSDSVASLPLYPYLYKDNWKYIDETTSLYNVLNIQPNAFMSAYTFKKMLVTQMLLNGNAYILIHRDKKASVYQLTLLNSNSIQVTFNATNTDFTYVDTVANKTYDKSEIIHILNYTTDGFRGLSTISYACDVLELGSSIQTHTNNFFKGGSNMSGILSPEVGTTLNEGSAKKLKEKIKASTDIYAGQSNGIVVLDGGFKYTPISVSAKDSQMIESKSLNEVDICKFFGVPPSLAFSNGSAKFGTAEQEQIGFLNNSLTALLEKIESEMFRKIYLPSEYSTHELKFDVENLFRSDATTKAAYFTQLYNLGALSTNEIREKINSKYPVTGGNRHFVQVNLQPIDKLYADNKGNTPAIDKKVRVKKTNNKENGE